jgi:predicted outer membrane protein
MKTIPHRILPLPRGSRPWAVALLGVCISVAPLSAQSNSDATSSGSITPDNSAPGSGAANQSTVDEFSREQTSRSTAAKPSLKRGDRRFITKAAESNQKEIALAQLAADQATRPEVRSYAQQLVAEHRQLGRELAKLADEKGIALEEPAAGETTSAAQYSDLSRATSGDGVTGSPSSATAADRHSPRNEGDSATAGASSMRGHEHAGMASSVASDRHYRTLAGKTGAEFDKAFVALMAGEHKRDVKLFEKAAQDADDSEVRNFASQHVASLQAHLDHANTLAESAAE